MKRKMTRLASAILLAVIMVTAWTGAGSETVTVKVPVEYPVAEAREMLKLINDFRTSKTEAWQWNADDKTKTVFNDESDPSSVKLQPLTLDYGMESTAMTRAAELSVTYYPAHYRPTGEYCFTAFPEGLISEGENIASGYNAYTTAKSVFEAWKEDDFSYAGQGHRRNMLNPDYTTVGIGYTRIGNYHFWTQSFGNPETGQKEKKYPETTKVKASVDLLVSEGMMIIGPSVDVIRLTEGEGTKVPNVTALSPEGVEMTITDPGWKSGKKKVATVQGGKVIGGTKGKTQLTWKDGEGNALASVQVIVQKLIPVKKIELNITQKTLKLKTGKTVTLRLKAIVTPEDATNPKLTWSSSNEKVATVSSSGKVTALKKGSCTITASATDGSGKKASCKIKVVKQ